MNPIRFSTLVSIVTFSLMTLPTVYAMRNARSHSSISGRNSRRSSYSNNYPTYYRHNFFNHIGDIFSFPITFNSLIQQHDRQIEHLQRSVAPRYEIVTVGNKLELSLDLPNAKAEDITVHLEQEGKVLKISGSTSYYNRQYPCGNKEAVSSDFHRMFTVDNSILDVEKMSVTLTNGILRITVPKFQANENQEVHIPIIKESDSLESAPVMEYLMEDKMVMKEHDDGNKDKGKTEKSEGIEISEEEDI